MTAGQFREYILLLSCSFRQCGRNLWVRDRHRSSKLLSGQLESRGSVNGLTTVKSCVSIVNNLGVRCGA